MQGNYALIANPDMEGETGLAILNEVVAALAKAGILVILDNRSSEAEWCCKNDGNSSMGHSRIVLLTKQYVLP
jgi:hypothetical protein